MLVLVLLLICEKKFQFSVIKITDKNKIAKSMARCGVRVCVRQEIKRLLAYIWLF